MIGEPMASTSADAAAAAPPVPVSPTPTEIQSSSSSVVGDIDTERQRSTGTRKRKSADAGLSDVLETASGTLSMVMDRFNTRPESDEVDLFFRSLALQFKQLPTDIQPATRLKLMQTMCEAQGYRPATGAVDNNLYLP